MGKTRETATPKRRMGRTKTPYPNAPSDPLKT